MKESLRVKLRLAAAAIVAFAAAGVWAALPDGYTQVAYIEATGTQWIDTEYVPVSNTSVRAEYQLTDWSKGDRVYIFGVYNNGSSARCQFSQLKNGNLFCGFGGTYNNTTPYPLSTDRHVVELSGGIFFIDEERVCPTSTFWKWAGGTSKNLYLFACNSGSSGALNIGPSRLYSCKISEDGVVVCDFVPCINSEGKVGLLDVAGGRNVFHANKAKSGADFTAGPFLAGINIVGFPENYGHPCPDYGSFSDLVVGEEVEFDCPSLCERPEEGIISACDGWTLVPETGEGLSGGGTNAVFTYEGRMAGAIFSWLWRDEYYRLKVSLPESPAEFAYDPAPDYTNEVGELFYALGTQVRITATAADSRFVWSCEGAEYSASGNVLTLITGAGEVRVKCAVRGRWHWDVDNGLISNGNWTLTCACPVTVNGTTGIRITGATSGSGGIDLTTFKVDTAGDASAAGLPNYDVIAIVFTGKGVNLTEFIGPAVIMCGNSTFSSAGALERVVLSPNVCSLGKNFCDGATVLVEFQPTDMPELETLGEWAFTSCTSLKGDFTMGKIKAIPENTIRYVAITSFSGPLVEKLSGGALGYLASITNISLPSLRNIAGGGINESVGKLETLTFDGAMITNLGAGALAKIKAPLPTGWPALERMGEGAFRNATGLKGDITMSKVPTLDAAFDGCTALTSVFAPKCDLYGNSAFKGCTALTNVTVFGGSCFPDEMPSKNPVSGSFSGTTAMKTLNWLAKTAPSSLPAQAFSNGTLAKNGSPVIVRAKITAANRAQWESYCTTLAADFTDAHRRIANWDQVKNAVIGFVGTVSESGGDVTFTAAGGNICWIVDSTRVGMMILLR